MLLKIILGLCIAGIVILAAVIIESKRENSKLEVSFFEFPDKSIKKPVKIVMLADLHNKEFGEHNQILINKLLELSPDIVMIPGDLIVGKKGVKENAAVKFLNDIGRSFPVFVSKGNHESRTGLYTEQYGDMWDILYAATKDNVKWLINESYYISDLNISVTGLDMDASFYQRFKLKKMDESYLEDLLPAINRSSYNILLAHNPDYFDAYAAWGADLVFSGHNHGGLIIIPNIGGLISPMVRLFPRYYKGLYEINDSRMILTGGLGGHTLNFRVNNKPEICVINLSNK